MADASHCLLLAFCGMVVADRSELADMDEQRGHAAGAAAATRYCRWTISRQWS
jgi:hypothetical protein